MLKKIPILIYLFLLVLPVLTITISINLFKIILVAALFYWLYKLISYSIFSLISKFQNKKEINCLKKLSRNLVSPEQNSILKTSTQPSRQAGPTFPMEEETNDILHLGSNSVVDKKNIPYQVFIIAAYKESSDVISKSIDSILSQDYPSDMILIGISLEQRNPEYSKVLSDLTKRYNSILNNKLFLFSHPEGLADEVPGAASNRTWCANKIKEILISKKINLANSIATIPDADTVFAASYCSELALRWLNNLGDKTQYFYQTSNYKVTLKYLQANIFSRIIARGTTAGIAGSSLFESKSWYPFSCFSISFDLLDKVNYWDKSIAIDDTPFFWRPFEYLEGNFACQKLLSELKVEAVWDESFLKSAKKLYRQMYRWGWGIIAFPIGIQTITQTRNLSQINKLIEYLKLLEKLIVDKAILYFFASSFILLSLNTSLIENSILDQTIKFLFSIGISLIGFSFFTSIIYTPKEFFKKHSFLSIVIIALEFLIGSVVLYLFIALPFLIASFDLATDKKVHQKVKWSVNY